MKSKIILSVFLFLSLSFVFNTYAGTPLDVLIVINYMNEKHESVPIAVVQTDKNGEIKFSFPDRMNVPKNGIFLMTIKPQNNTKGSIAKKASGMEEQTIEVPFTKKDGPKFKYIVFWEPKSKSNQGGFAVSGRNSSVVSRNAGVVNEISKHTGIEK